MDGPTLLSSTLLSISNSLDLEPMGSGNFDSDGTADFLVRNIVNGNWHMFLLNGPAVTPYNRISIIYDLNWWYVE